MEFLFFGRGMICLEGNHVLPSAVEADQVCIVIQVPRFGLPGLCRVEMLRSLGNGFQVPLDSDMEGRLKLS